MKLKFNKAESKANYKGISWWNLYICYKIKKLLLIRFVKVINYFLEIALYL